MGKEEQILETENDIFAQMGEIEIPGISEEIDSELLESMEENADYFDDDPKDPENPDTPESTEEDLDFEKMLNPDAPGDPASEKKDEDLDIEEFNKKLGTDFKSIEDIKKSLKAEDVKDELSEEEKNYNVAKSLTESLASILEYDDETLTKEYFFSIASKEGKNVSSEEVKEEIEDRINVLKDSNTLKDFASNVRMNIKGSYEKNKSVVDTIDNKRSEREQKTIRERNENLQNAFSDIFKAKEFLGITVNQQDVTEAYKSIKNNSFFDKVNNNPQLVAKLAMFVLREEEIQKRATAPTYSDAAERFAKELGIFDDKTKQRSIAAARSGNGNLGTNQIVNDFIK